MNEYTEHTQVHRGVEERQKTMKDILPELLAAVQHEIWSHWMKYLFKQCESVEGGWLIPSDKATRWVRQMNTPYSELSEKEKDSDRDQARKVIDALGVDGYLH